MGRWWGGVGWRGEGGGAGWGGEGAWELEAGVDHRSIMARKDEPQNTHVLLRVVLKQRYNIPVERERERERGKKGAGFGSGSHAADSWLHTAIWPHGLGFGARAARAPLW